MPVEVGQYLIGDGFPTFVVAEMAWSHDGSRDKAIQIVEAAARGGAQAVNLHVTSLENYMVPHYGCQECKVGETGKVYRFLKDISLGEADWIAVVHRARELGLLVSAMCNDFPSVKFAIDHLEPEMVMIHPSCVGEDTFVREVARTMLPLMLYVGGLTLEEVEHAARTAQGTGNDRIILQHGFQSYPTPIEDNDLAFIQTLKSLFGFPVSFGDHTDGGDPLALIVPIVAVAMGANVLEKHLTYNRAAKGTDFESALDPVDFRTFVDRLRQVETARGDGEWKALGDRQLKYRQTVRKRAVASRGIRQGEVLSECDVVFKRSDKGVYPDELGLILGRPAKKDIERDMGLIAELFL